MLDAMIITKQGECRLQRIFSDSSRRQLAHRPSLIGRNQHCPRFSSHLPQTYLHTNPSFFPIKRSPHHATFQPLPLPQNAPFTMLHDPADINAPAALLSRFGTFLLSFEPSLSRKIVSSLFLGIAYWEWIPPSLATPLLRPRFGLFCLSCMFKPLG